jgi:hypothetical protein
MVSPSQFGFALAPLLRCSGSTGVLIPLFMLPESLSTALPWSVAHVARKVALPHNAGNGSAAVFPLE